eukprot:4587961-Amphidinium_carterae.1
MAEHRRTGLSLGHIKNQFLIDHRPAPELRPGRVILCPYVDNANIIAYSATETHDGIMPLLPWNTCWRRR